IRDLIVTGVQTCALPIFDPLRDTAPVLKAHAQKLKANPQVWSFLTGEENNLSHFAARFGLAVMRNDKDATDISHTLRTVVIDGRSEERRVGKECKRRWRP